MADDEVDLIIVDDHDRAQTIIKALKHGGLRHVEFWPEHMLGFYGGKAIGRAYPHEDQLGPYHVRVRQEDLDRARLILSSAGLLP